MPLPLPVRRFTGRHMAVILVCFFAVVVGVNLLMAKFAIGTFGGTVVENSYVASQEYNGWLAAAEAQRKAGWRATFALDPARHPVLGLTIPAGIDVAAKLSANATHVLGRAAPIDMQLHRQADGHWVGVLPLPQGRWQIQINVPHQGGTARFRETIG